MSWSIDESHSDPGETDIVRLPSDVLSSRRLCRLCVVRALRIGCHLDPRALSGLLVGRQLPESFQVSFYFAITTSQSGLNVDPLSWTCGANYVSRLLIVRSLVLIVRLPRMKDVRGIQVSVRVAADPLGFADTNFTVLVTNSDPATLNGALPLVSIQCKSVFAVCCGLQLIRPSSGDYDCSVLLPSIDLKVGTGYTLSFADVFNQSHIIASSSAFEVKAQGSTSRRAPGLIPLSHCLS